MRREVLRVSDLSVTVDGRQLLKHISFSAFSGESLAICGLRFAGKSVLARLLTGEAFPYSGSVLIEGRPHRAPGAVDPRSVYYISESGNQFGALSIADVFFGVRKPHVRQLFYRSRAANAQMGMLLKRLGIDAAPDAPATELTLAQLHRLHIEKALSVGARVIILDAIADNYGHDEMKALIKGIDGARDAAVIYLGNRADMVVENADRVLVIRNGYPAGLIHRADFQAPRFEAMMRGGNEPAYGGRIAPRDAPVAARLDIPALAGAPLAIEVGEGEIVGLCDLTGGNTERIVQALTTQPGNLLRLGEEAPRSYEHAVRLGLAVVTHNYPIDSYLAPLSARDNLSFQVMKRVSRLGLTSERIIDYIHRTAPREFAGTDELGPIEGALVRWLVARPKLLVLENVLIGLDLDTRKNVFEILGKATAQGVAVLMITSDYADCEAFCDRTYTI